MERDNDYKERVKNNEYGVESKGSVIDRILNNLLVFEFSELINIILVSLGILCPFIPIIFLFRKDIIIEIGFWQTLLITVLANCIVLIWMFILGLINNIFKIERLELKVKLIFKIVDIIQKKAGRNLEAYKENVRKVKEESTLIKEEIKAIKENQKYEKKDEIQIKLQKAKKQSFKTRIIKVKCKIGNFLIKINMRNAKKQLNKVNSLVKIGSKSNIFLDAIIYNIILGIFVFGLKGMDYFIKICPSIGTYIKIKFTFLNVTAMIISLYISISLYFIISIIRSVFYTSVFSSKENKNNTGEENEEL